MSPSLHGFNGQPLTLSAFIGSLSHSYPYIMWGPAHATRTLCPAKTRHAQTNKTASQPADIHQPVMLFRLTRTYLSRESLRPSISAGYHSLLPPTTAHRRRQHLHRRDKPPSPVSMPSLHSAPAARHPSRGVRRLCSHRATKDMGKPPILAHPHTTQPTLVQRHRHPSPPTSSALQSVGLLRLAYIRLLCPPKVPTAATAPHVTV